MTQSGTDSQKPPSNAKPSSFSPPLTRPEQILEMVAELKKHEIIGFDTEFIRESTFFPQLEILQVGTLTQTWLIDVPAFKRSLQREEPEGLKPLFEVFRDPKILKILHAAQADQECLYTSFGVIASPTLDTEVAGSLCGYGDGIGLGNLLKAVLGVSLQKGHARTDWSVRPLPPHQIEYAHADVVHLVEMAQKLFQELEKLGRKDWALKSSGKWEDPLLHDVPAQTIADRLARGGRVDRKGYPVLIELVKWREKRVREINVPRRWLADDAVLLDLAQVRPKDLNHLGTFRGLNRGELKNQGKILLDLIESASQMELARPTSGPKQDPATPEEGRALDLLKCYIGMLADRHDVATKHIILSDQMLRLLRSQPKTVEDLKRDGILNADSIRLVGEEIVAILSGQRALSIRKNYVKVVQISNVETPAGDKSSE